MSENTKAPAYSTGPSLGRRAVIGGLIAAVAVVAAYVLRRPGDLSSDLDGALPRLPPEFGQRLRELLPANGGSHEVAEAAAEALSQRSQSWSDVGSVLHGIDAQPFDRAMSAVRQRCHDDYASGRTVRVDSWVLSRTEAELLALLG